MFCKSLRSNRYWGTLLIAGVISLIFGVVGHISISSISENGDMLLGMFSGMGGAFTVVSTFKLLHKKFASPSKLKEEEINLKDERNVQILRAAYTIANCAATVLFAVLAFVFVCLNYIIPSFLAVGAIWIQLLVFFISYSYFSKKM